MALQDDFKLTAARDFAPAQLTNARAGSWGAIYNAILDVIQGNASINIARSALFLPFDSVSQVLAQLNGDALDTIAAELNAVFYDGTWGESLKRLVLVRYFTNPNVQGSADWLQYILRALGSTGSFILDSRTYTQADVTEYESTKDSVIRSLGALEHNQFVILLEVGAGTPSNSRWTFVESQVRSVYGWRLKGFIFRVTSTIGIKCAVACVDTATFYDNDWISCEKVEPATNGYIYSADTNTLTPALYDDDAETVEYEG